MPRGKNWYNLEVAQVLAALNVDRDGLSQMEAKRRLAEFGFNELVEEKRTGNGCVGSDAAGKSVERATEAMARSRPRCISSRL
jgi:hypothetical protein